MSWTLKTFCTVDYKFLLIKLCQVFHIKQCGNFVGFGYAHVLLTHLIMDHSLLLSEKQDISKGAHIKTLFVVIPIVIH